MSLGRLAMLTLAITFVVPACSNDDDPTLVDDCGCVDAPYPDLSGGFGCGQTLNCQVGEYCVESLGGVCGGDPLPDAGTCPANCVPTLCGTNTTDKVCLCTGYSCTALPT
ncbi:MAG: hypothetical protein JRH20_30425, partial [Deltaproteobacteria bacterium]|nr:hypothetical protein [Deltaproteobacteria bacterium]